ncbi:MFS transporter [Secundilactobacillus hailunensis]|uniref:MFS transporter n=1 Tax=Secundilactobacillus hailunensis TaxID=2559923 RepID=A0ABW1T6V2_9LACO|nr:MFS transporter [Secundilactobacillus hailunensis]
MKKVTIPLIRLVPGLILGPASWLGPYVVINSLFLPALIQNLDPANKVKLVAIFSMCGMIVSAISNIIAGAVSDNTRSRFGKRTPSMVVGAFFFMLTSVGAAFSPNIPVLLIFWMLTNVGLNFMVAPIVAWIDMAPKGSEGTASSAYGGLGMALGNNGFNVVGALFLSRFRLGFIIFGIFTFVGILVSALIVHEPSNLDEKIQKKSKEERFSWKDLKTVFPSWKKGRDYYLALIGKLFQGIGNFAITGYILYIMTDFLHRGSQTQSSIQLINTIMLVLGIFMGFVAGPISDKFKILKMPIVIATFFLAIGAIALFILRNELGIIIYAFSAGIGMGMWNSLDNLLNLKVIPDKNRVAFFLGVYNLGNSLPQAVAPVIAATVISSFGYSGIFIVSAIFSLIGGFSMFMIKGVKR